jgi:hypothetical protein
MTEAQRNRLEAFNRSNLQVCAFDPRVLCCAVLCLHECAVPQPEAVMQPHLQLQQRH